MSVGILATNLLAASVATWAVGWITARRTGDHRWAALTLMPYLVVAGTAVDLGVSLLPRDPLIGLALIVPSLTLAVALLRAMATWWRAAEKASDDVVLGMVLEAVAQPLLAMIGLALVVGFVALVVLLIALVVSPR